MLERVDCDLLSELDQKKPGNPGMITDCSRRVGSYSFAFARDGATNQATTRTAKLAKAAAITSWLLRLDRRDRRPVT